jgi:hypothetical protein
MEFLKSGGKFARFYDLLVATNVASPRSLLDKRPCLTSLIFEVLGVLGR